MTQHQVEAVAVPGLVIRTARETDLLRLASLDQAVFAPVHYPLFVLRQLFDVHHHTFLVGEYERRIRGYALSAPCSVGGSAWLLGLGVQPEYRGLGIGPALLVNAMARLRALRLQDVRLTVRQDDTSLVRFYEAAGFGVEAVRPDYLGPGEDRMVMVARLDGPASEGIAPTTTAT